MLKYPNSFEMVPKLARLSHALTDVKCYTKFNNKGLFYKNT